MSARPNILLIQADQMAADCIGAAGHPVVRTPNFDRLANEGVLFDNAYCNSPVCAPSRASLATGTLIRTCGVYDNAAEFSSEIPTIYHHLNAAGYETAGSGKFHFVGPDQLHGLSRRLTTDVFPANFAWTPDWAEGPIESEGMNGSVVARAREISSNTYVDFDEEVLFRSLEFIRERGRDRGALSSHARRSLESASDAAGPSPFFLQVSFSHPHPPFEAMRRFLDLYPDPAPPPEHPDLPADPNLYEQWMITLNRLDTAPVSAEATELARRCYYAMVSYVDEMVGRLLDELDRHGLAADTVVIFTSDHGEMLGEKGLWYKRMYHEPSIRVPLIVRDPRRAGTDAGRREAAVVSLIDLSAEVLRIAGADVPADFDGNGLSRAPGRAIFEYFGKGTVAPLFGVRRDNWKLVEIPDRMTLLYDLESDPHELRNLAEGNESERIRRLREELYAGVDVEGLQADIVASQARRLALRDLHEGHQPAWDYQPIFDAAVRYIRPSVSLNRAPTLSPQALQRDARAPRS